MLMPKYVKKEKNKKPWIEGSGNIFKDLGFSNEEAANLLARTDLMLEIRRIVQQRHLTQMEAARLLQIRQPRIAEIMAMKIEDYSVDTLLKYLARLGKKVTMNISDADQAA
jgi:predicted XRE-type DNA-binding protein